jgi:hypothetical protein
MICNDCAAGISMGRATVSRLFNAERRFALLISDIPRWCGMISLAHVVLSLRGRFLRCSWELHDRPGAAAADW